MIKNCSANFIFQRVNISRKYWVKTTNIMFSTQKTAFLLKNYWDLLYFHKKVLKNVWLSQRYSKFSLSHYSVLCQAWKSYTRSCWPGMGKQTCNQHWIGRGQGVSLTIFVSVSKIKKFLKRVFKDPQNIFLKSGLSLRGNYKAMFTSWIWSSVVNLSLKSS